MFLVTYEDEISFTRKHVDYMSNDWLAIDLDQWLWNNMPCAAKPLTKTRHGHDNLHKISNCVDSGVCLELLKPNELIEFKSLR